MSDAVNVEWIPEPLLYTVSQTARALNVSERTVSNLLRAGQLVRRKIGSRTLIPKSSIEAFLKRDHPTMSQKDKQPKEHHHDIPSLS